MTDQSYQPSVQFVKSVGEEIREIVQCQMRQAALKMVYELFQQEVEQLCGSPFSRKGEDGYYRGGSDPSSVLIQGQRVKVKKPKIRKGKKLVPLETHAALNNYDLLCKQVMEHMMSGVSTRNYNPLLNELENGLGLKKSSVSKAFVKASQESLDLLNNRDLSQNKFVSIMVDGICFGDKTIIVALGIDINGKKLILGLQQGASENWEVCRDLFSNLIDRGLCSKTTYLFVIDGSKALKKGIRKTFKNNCPIQRCIRHKERNIIKYLSKENHFEFYRRWKKLHGFCDYSAAKEEYEKLMKWVGSINHEAANSLKEAEMETLTVIQLQVPNLLRKTFSSTNPIESVFSISKPKMSRVRNWKSSPDQLARWTGSALIEAEKKFRTIKGYKDLPVFFDQLQNLNVENYENVA